MNRKLYAATALALPVAAAGIVAAGAASHPGGHDRGVIELTTKRIHRNVIDHGTPGFSEDDVIVFSNDLYRGNQKVGEDGGSCTVTRIADDGSVTAHCLGTNSLPGGQLSTQGLAPGSGLFELAITGGTGRYSHAHGQVFGKETSPTEMSIRIVLK
jgi:hypothetical protein